jgi:hypothetical protein
MNGVEAQLAVIGIAPGGVAYEVADSNKLQDRQQEGGEQDADPLGRRAVVAAETTSAGNHPLLDISDRCNRQVAYRPITTTILTRHQFFRAL